MEEPPLPKHKQTLTSVLMLEYYEQYDIIFSFALKYSMLKLSNQRHKFSVELRKTDSIITRATFVNIGELPYLKHWLYPLFIYILNRTTSDMRSYFRRPRILYSNYRQWGFLPHIGIFFPCFANIAMFEDFQGCR